MYVGLTHTPEEIARKDLTDIAPTRLTKGGPNAPTVLTLETEDKKPRWVPKKPVGEYDENDRKRLLGAM